MTRLDGSTTRKRRVARQLPEAFVFRATGHSMLPCIRPGDLLRIGRCDSYERGDVLLFEHEGALLAHRVIGHEGEGHDRLWILRGDNRRRNDPPVPAGDVLGRVETIERGGRTLALDGPFGRVWRLLARLSIVGIPLTYLLAVATRRLQPLAA